MTKEKMIDKIYEVIADKTLSFGCIYLDRERRKCTYYPCTTIHKDTNDLWNFYWHYYEVEDWENIWYIKIIWHPVMIWDVLQRTSLHNDEIIKKWHDMRKPIDDQSEECITFIYNLTQDDN